jgi:oligoendopeptidase F
MPLLHAPLTAATTDAETGAESVRWDLSDLYPDPTALASDMSGALDAAREVESAFKGTLSEAGADEIASLLRRAGDVQDRAGRAMGYVFLNWSTQTTDPEAGKLLQATREAYAKLGQHLVFVETEWAALDPERAQALASAPELADFAHYLETLSLRRAHVLSEEVERVLSDTNVTGRAAWVRFFDQTLGEARFEFEREQVSKERLLAKLHEADRDVRRAAAHAVTDGLERLSKPLTYIFNTVLADKAALDKRRGYPHWLASRNLSNETDDATVEALVGAVTARYDLAQRYYRLKARVLGIDDFADYDRYAPLGQSARTFTWDEARTLVTDAYSGFSDEAGAIVERFFDERWIDAPMVDGKRGGAFSHGVVPSAHPYILMNYTGRARDVQTLAHELGHGVHQFLAREQGIYHAGTPLTTAETASVFGEMLTFQKLIDGAGSDDDRLAMLLAKIDDSMSTVFRQVSMNRFEASIHTARREGGELTPDHFGELWMETQTALYGDSVALSDGYRRWWSYIPHFLHTPGYVYAYAFGELLVQSLYARYREAGPDFAPAYLDVLRAGGSRWPHELMDTLGVDIREASFWSGGLGEIESLIDQAEALAQD